MMNEPLSLIMTRDVITADQNDSLAVARNIFLKNKVHHLPIVNGSRLVGILTTYDLFKLNGSQKSIGYDDMTIKDIMTTHIATLEPEDKIGSAAELFLENLFHRKVELVTPESLSPYLKPYITKEIKYVLQ